MKGSLCILALFSCMLIATILPSQNVEPVVADSSSMSLFEFWHQQKDSLPLLHLDTDWGLLIRKKMEEEYQPAVLSFSLEDGSKAALDVKVRARGNIRKEVCFYPPIKIKAKKKQLKAIGFNDINELKLVMPCKNGGNYSECTIREALAYSVYESIHPIHYKTKMVRLEISSGDKGRRTFPAFLVEDEEELEARLDAKVLDRGVIRPSTLERDPYVKMCFFQYMIANVDWSVSNKHNIEMVSVPGFDKVLALPYDFDYAGFTGTGYAVPAQNLPIDNVNQRYFMGNKITEEEARNTAQFFLSKKEEIFQKFESFDLIDEKMAASLKKYVRKFFNLLEEEKKMLRIFANAK